jgi:hypothetical protein
MTIDMAEEPMTALAEYALLPILQFRILLASSRC